MFRLGTIKISSPGKDIENLGQMDSFYQGL